MFELGSGAPHRITPGFPLPPLSDNNTEVDGTTLEWNRNDAFCVPAWSWHRHANDSSDDAVLYSVTDAPTLKKLALYREEGKTAAGEVIKIAP